MTVHVAFIVECRAFMLLFATVKLSHEKTQAFIYTPLSNSACIARGSNSPIIYFQCILSYRIVLDCIWLENVVGYVCKSPKK